MSFPFHDQEFEFPQPDGTTLRVRGSGDQHHAAFETLDGTPLVRDPSTGFYRPAAPNPNSKGLESLASSGELEDTLLTQDELLTPRWKERYEGRRAAFTAGFESLTPQPAPPARMTVGDYVGLCLLVQFPGQQSSITREDVEAFCNQPGYTGFGNHGSVYDYFLENSAGRLRYTTIVAPYYTTKRAQEHYTNASRPYGEGARELIQETLAYHKSQGFDFSSLTADDQAAIYATNVFYAGRVVNGWGKGLWPHASRLLAAYPLAPGRNAVDYQITNLGDSLTLGTYCHENGHMLCDFPDLYSYANQRKGVGVYCLMCLGGNADPRNPSQISAYLKYRAGWANPVTFAGPGLKTKLVAGQNHFIVHHRSPTEYFIIENRRRSGRDAALTDSGLAIWHVDELGNNSRPETSPPGHQRFECTLIQADGRPDLERGANLGDATDLFRAGLNARFAGTTSPASLWADGTASGLDVRDIGPAGDEVAVSVDV